ncbi:MAG: SDR family oxidoreductase [Aestuariivirga sp.]|nr:SDR family oxidoreductase [Aestuariivirga sp.]
MTGLLDGNRILITGAARGIGLAVAEAAVAAGARVALADIDAAELLPQAKARGAAAIVMDVGDALSVRQGVAEAAAVLGGLGGLVNNAAILDESHAGSVSEQRFHEVLSVNLTSILRVSQAALPFLREGPSAIVNTLSTQAMFGQPNSVAYAAAKGGGLNLTRAMAVDLAPVRVNAVAPGFIDTRMAIMQDGTHEHAADRFRDVYIAQRKIPLARPGTPGDCAGVFLFLLSDLARYVTGQCIAVDGGLTATY